MCDQSFRLLVFEQNCKPGKRLVPRIILLFNGLEHLFIALGRFITFDHIRVVTEHVTGKETARQTEHFDGPRTNNPGAAHQRPNETIFSLKILSVLSNKVVWPPFIRDFCRCPIKTLPKQDV
jgi:hypothetical protein